MSRYPSSCREEDAIEDERKERKEEEGRRGR
jgi:hypothetical protein